MSSSCSPGAANDGVRSPRINDKPSASRCCPHPARLCPACGTPPHAVRPPGQACLGWGLLRSLFPWAGGGGPRTTKATHSWGSRAGSAFLAVPSWPEEGLHGRPEGHWCVRTRGCLLSGSKRSTEPKPGHHFRPETHAGQVLGTGSQSCQPLGR